VSPQSTLYLFLFSRFLISNVCAPSCSIMCQLGNSSCFQKLASSRFQQRGQVVGLRAPRRRAPMGPTGTSRRARKHPRQITSFRCPPILSSAAVCHQRNNDASGIQDKPQYFPQDPTCQPFPPLSTDPKVTASVQVPLKVEVERRKRLFSNQDIM